MGVLDYLLIVIIVLFALGALGCLVALPSVIWQFVRVLFEKDEPEEQSRHQAAD